MITELDPIASAPCGLVYNSSRKQLEALVILLCAIQAELDGGLTDCGDFTGLLETASATGLSCRSIGQLKAKAAELVCTVLDVDCKALECFSAQDLEILRVYLTDQIVNGLGGPPIIL